jgi:predicted flap endonuclease-1-like 5' DNA nuclease
MSLLFSIIRAVHATGSHHKLALDALAELRHPDAAGWQRLFLKHADVYLTASKLPDTEFKDFKNHVLHVRENFWGGAPERAQHWYGELVEDLKGERWADAIRAAGILSHYVVDPLQPLHTGQCEAENAVHRAIEWSISRSFDDLRSGAPADEDNPALRAATGPTWLANAIAAGAEAANQHYESLLLHYDLHKGLVDPPAGLDRVAQRIVGALIRTATSLNAHVLDRAFIEAGTTPPTVTLTTETVLAAIKIPAKMWTKRISDSTDRKAVQAMYDELMATGRVEAALDEENRTIRDLHRAEVLALAKPRPKPAALFPAPARTPRRSSSDKPVAVALPAAAATPPAPAPIRQPVAQLREDSPLEEAHSIGPKLAQRFAAMGITKVGDFLKADAGLLAASLNLSQIKPDDVRVWQDQARLGCSVPGLSGGQTQILVASGCRTPAALAGAEPADLHRAIAKLFVDPAEKERLRLGALPSIEMVTSWIGRARLAAEKSKAA